jgi:hypothetical protein
MGILDLFGGNTDREDARQKEAIEAIRREYGNISLPELMQLEPELMSEIGPMEVSTAIAPTVAAPERLEVDPAQTYLADTFLQGDTEMSDINTDPRLVDAQMQALTGLQGVADSGGMTLADEAALNRIQGQSAQADKGRRDAILQNMQARGMGGSGLELLAQLQSSQAATDQASQQGLDVAGMAQQRALDAMMRGGSLAGDIRGQGFGEQAAIKSAQDEINKFNAANLTQGSQFNTGNLNQGEQFNTGLAADTGQFNIGLATDVATGNANRTAGTNQFNAGQTNDMSQFVTGTNVGINQANTQAMNRAQETNRIGIPQQQFSNQMSKAGGVTQGLAAEADMYGNRGDRKKKEAGEVFGAITKGGTAIATGGA